VEGTVVINYTLHIHDVKRDPSCNALKSEGLFYVELRTTLLYSVDSVLHDITFHVPFILLYETKQEEDARLQISCLCLFIFLCSFSVALTYRRSVTLQSK
jgi:hypothetical protein